jgi:hypothetical protein
VGQPLGWVISRAIKKTSILKGKDARNHDLVYDDESVSLSTWIKVKPIQKLG